MKDLIDHFKYKWTPPLVLASTGLASVNIWWQTVHSFFWLPITNPHHSEIKMKIKKDKLKTLVDSSFIIIDEISMLSSNILDCIDQKIRILTADYFWDNSLKQKPFGGKKMLFVWDLFQLPPIVQDERKMKFKEIYNSEFFFDSLSIKNFPYEVIELQENYRQWDDIEFWNILDRIREGEFDRNDITKINTRVSSEIENFGILLTTTNKTADDFNSTKLGLIDKPIYSFYANISGVFPNNMKKVPDILDLKEGAQIIMLNNNPYKQWVNGDLWIIEEIDEENGIIKVLINNKSFDVETVQFKNIEVRIIDEETSILDDNGKEKKLKEKNRKKKLFELMNNFLWSWHEL